ncbi:MAG TPA: hypothetical protein VIR34_06390 [Gemmatimonadaceae bacterium]
MGMAATIDFYSGDMVRELNAREPRHWPRYETVHGELLVSPGPRPWHQLVVGRLLAELYQYLDDAVFPLVERESLTWQPAGASAPFTLSLEELFRPL